MNEKDKEYFFQIIMDDIAPLVNDEVYDEIYDIVFKAIEKHL